MRCFIVKCECCKKSFDEEDERIVFEGAILLTYNNLVLRLCADCAIKTIEDEDEDVYFETCGECGKRFDYIVEKSDFERNPNDYGRLTDYWDDGDKPRCAECAIKEAERQFEEYRDEYPEDFDAFGYDED